ncbi:MAG: ECF transporter S component [Clostridia bacterium]|nr:ECF transporter S component [Clostridia bacterium]
MKREYIQKLVLSAMLLALGMVLPFFVGQIKEIGDSLLPMHLPVMLCGLLCGWKYGLSVGGILPFLRSVSFGMPPLYPNAIWMALELATYGFVIGMLYCRRKSYSRAYLFFCLVCSMIAGRIVWGISKAILLGVAGKPFGFAAFLTGAFLDAIPGIVLQFILIPLIAEIVIHKKARATGSNAEISK